MIEAMCIVCHGPIPRKGRTRGVTASTCHENCRAVWKRMVGNAVPLPHKYQHLRWLHAQRRQDTAVLLRIIRISNVLEMCYVKQA